ncbi:MAG: FeoB-associated Cys-rich membrane protein [Treponema sp.]|nr:FeoB-associated Cys-rich membrane protein [Treponema sp.]
MAGTIVTGTILGILVILVIFKLVKDKKRGKSNCGASCTMCPMAKNCSKPQKTE